MKCVNITVASPVLASVQSELHANVSQLQWVVGGYALAFATVEDWNPQLRDRTYVAFD
jgi:hypothetical protein